MVRWLDWHVNLVTVDTNDDWHTAATVLRLASQLVEGVQAGLAHRGFDDVRPAHGFAFVRISAGGTTTGELAVHLGITKQAASQLVEQLVQRGYLTREEDPRDARARVLRLTERGRGCTAAARAAAIETVEAWRGQLEPAQFETLRTALDVVVVPGRLRPSW